jgi:BirA family biotin operon repressor/biotin-[acetyl-CoA-carboxylase] ligase
MADNRDDNTRLEKFLAFLKENKEGFVSGQSLARGAGISRSAVWKNIKKLRQYGYAVESLHGQGYRLAGPTESPVPWELYRILETSFVGKKNNIVYRQNVDSTQSVAIAIAEKQGGDKSSGTVVIAEQQSSGRGRMKRRWVSPLGGLWLSVVLRPAIPTAASTMLPFVAAVAVCDAVRDATALDATLKWPNDVMVAGKKVAGILLDLSAEADAINYAVIGIGVNANVDASKIKIEREEGRPPVTSLQDELGHAVSRLALAKLLLEKLERYCTVLESHGPEAIVEEWRKRSGMLGRPVRVMQHGRVQYSGVAAGINDDGSLRVRMDDDGGKEVAVVSGDVSVVY